MHYDGSHRGHFFEFVFMFPDWWNMCLFLIVIDFGDFDMGN